MNVTEEKKIRVFIVDDSMVFRSFLTKCIGDDDRFEVVGTAVDAFDAANKIPAAKPDVVTLDIEMPRMSGLEFLGRLLPAFPIPVVLVSTLDMRVFDALAAGAVDFVHKPDSYEGDNVTSFAFKIKLKIVAASRAKVHLPLRKVEAPSLGKKTETAAEDISGAVIRGNSKRDLIAIGASTGGTEAIVAVVRNLPESTPGIVITQHMPAGFTEMFAERLNRICKMEVREAKNGDVVRRGLILIAPGGLHMSLTRHGSEYAVICEEGEKVHNVAPSVDVLFNSVAEVAGEKAIGIILTGMGSDGASGLLKMRDRGAYTIGQDKETCVVYGMPMEAARCGAVQTVAPLNTIPSLIVKELNS